MNSTTSDNLARFIDWLSSTSTSSGYHVDVTFKSDGHGGHAVHATRDLPKNTTVVSMPFKLAITREVASAALLDLRKLSLDTDPFDGMLERQLICAYLALHWITGLATWDDDDWTPCSTVPSSSLSKLCHGIYLNTIPPPSGLRTPLFFTEDELEAFRGSNLYGATLDRRATGEREWRQCREIFETHLLEGLGSAFTWKMYLTTATYLSSRAFPSTVLSPVPSLSATPSSYPILLPGIDALNHKRGQPVTWAVDGAGTDAPSIKLIVHSPTPAGAEVFNNYGAKPNAELILGYGFVLEDNPEDTIVLSIGGRPTADKTASSKRWEVGRDARGAQDVFDEVLVQLRSGEVGDVEDDNGWEDELDAADMLSEMVSAYLERLPAVPEDPSTALRPEVRHMLEVYVTGQRDILTSMLNFAEDKRQNATEKARAAGVEIVEEDEEV